MAVAAADLKERLAQGFVVETRRDMDEGYYESLRQTLIVSADTEFVSVANLYTALEKAPDLNSQLTLLSIMQDELGHAHIAYKLLADLGEDVHWLIFERPPDQFKNPYAFEFSVDSWAELAAVNCLYDRAGFILLGDVYRYTSYGPWKRALAKVDKEENFHIRHGETWVRRLAADPATREEVQRAVDWVFPAALEFFGLPDTMKTRQSQLEYRIKGSTNDQLRQQWLASAVPFLQSCGLTVPAHYDQQRGEYVLDIPFPCAVDIEAKRWLIDRPVSWDEVLRRWKSGGPRTWEFIGMLQEGKRLLQTVTVG